MQLVYLQNYSKKISAIFAILQLLDRQTITTQRIISIIERVIGQQHQHNLQKL